MNKDIFNYDYLTISVKKSNLDEVMDCYSAFGWSVDNSSPDKRYENITELNLSRPHQIENKDELQFLQIGLESALYKKGKLIKNKHQKSTILGVTLGVLLVVIATCAIPMFSMSIFVGIMISLIAVGTLFSLPVLIPRLRKKEKLNFKINMKQINSNISDFKKKAKKIITGGQNE